MSRNASPRPSVVLILVLSGVIVGLTWDRLTVSAIPLRADGQSAKDGAVAPVPPAQARGTEEEVYRALAKRYQERFEEVDKTFETVARAVSPAVVHLVAKKTGKREDGSQTRYDETGSGVIVRLDLGKTLYVLTNNHVVDGTPTADLNICLQDGRVLHPERIWTDAKADIAVLKLGRDDLPTARLGDSDLMSAGNWVMAMGSPFGLTHSVSHGIISARGRHEKELEEEGVENQDFLQTDAAINPGNSGGPLVNMKGEVIGVNTAIATSHTGSEGVGFSIPINLARWAARQLVSGGKVTRGAMGVDLDDLKADRATTLGLKFPRGAQILYVHPTSPAERAGMKSGDVVVKFNGTSVVDLNHLINLVAMAPIGRPAAVIVWREGKEQACSVTVADREHVLASVPVPVAGAGIEPRDDPNARKPRSPRRSGPSETVAIDGTATALGMEMVTLDDDDDDRRIGLPASTRGVAVSRIDETSPLASALRPRDVITTIGGQPIRSAADLAATLKLRDSRTNLELGVRRLGDGVWQRFNARVP